MNWNKLTLKYGEGRLYLASIFFIFCAIFIGYKIGFWQKQKATQKVSDLEQSVDYLNQQNHELTRRLNILGVELEVERLASQKSQYVIQDALDDNTALKRELAFYQKVMAPELESQGVTIESLHIEPTLSENYFRYALVLMQRSKRTGYVKGNANIQVIGSENGQPKRYNLLKLEDVEPTLQFQFKYFYVFEGEVEMPSDFSPERVLVQANIIKAGKVDGQLQRTFDWLNLTQT